MAPEKYWKPLGRPGQPSELAAPIWLCVMVRWLISPRTEPISRPSRNSDCVPSDPDSTTWCQRSSLTVPVVVSGSALPFEKLPRSLPSVPTHSTGICGEDCVVVEPNSKCCMPSSGPPAVVLNHISTARSRFFLIRPGGSFTNDEP